MTLAETLLSVWQQALADDKQTVTLDRHRVPVEFTKTKHLRTVAFTYRRRKFFGIEQNPRTSSRWAKLARQGKRIMQFSHAGRYVANVSEGKLFRYPAWRMLKLPE
jgi:hypothetical protein